MTLRRVKLGPVTLHVECRGQGSAVVFVHGYTTTSQFWRGPADAVAVDHRVVSFDLRGHGQSTKPVGVDYTIEAFTADLLALLSELRIGSAVLVGLSMGGTVALQAALREPGLVRGLVLAGATARGVGAAVTDDHVLTRIAQVGVEDAGAEIIDASFAGGTDRGLVEWAKREVSVTPRHVAEAAIVSLGAFDVEGRLGEISCPTLVVVGERDVITPLSLAEVLHAGIPVAELVVVPGAGHFPMLEQPAVFTEAVQRFLSSLV